MKRDLFFIIIICAISVFVFRAFIFGGKLLFPTNMMAAFYPPWKTMTFPGWRLIPFKGLGHDNVLFFYPEKLLLRLSAVEKSLPLWNPYNFAGNQLFGDGQAAPMYPLTLLYILLPLPEAFSIMVILIPTLTMLFSYGMLRHFRLGRKAALFGAAAFAFSGFMTGWMEENPAVAQSAIWLPLLIWMEDLLITSPQRKWFIALTLATSTMMAAGFLQISLYAFFFMSAYALFRTVTLPIPAKEKGSRLFLWGWSVILGLAIIGPYLTTTWEAYKLSPRDFVPIPEIRSIFLVAWSHLISLFNPDWLGNPGSYNYVGPGSYYDRSLFVGVIPFLFILLGLREKKSQWEKFFWWAGAGTLFLGFSSPITQWLFAQPIPILTTMLPSRIFYLTSFSLAVVAATIFDRMQKKGWYESLAAHIRPAIVLYLLIIIVIEAFFITFLTEFNLPNHPVGLFAHMLREAISPTIQLNPALIPVAIRNVGFSFAITIAAIALLFLARKQKALRTMTPWILLVITVGTAWYLTSKSLYNGERLFLYPEHPMLTELQRVAGIDRIGFADDDARISPNVNTVYGLYSFEGLNPVFPYRYGQFIRSAINGGMVTNDIPRISVKMDLKEGVRSASTSGRIQTMLSLADVKYIVELKESGWYARTYPSHKPIWEGELFRIWENTGVLPRAFIASDVKVITNAQEILDELYRADLRNTAIVEEPIYIPSSANKNNSVSMIDYNMNNITMTVHTESAGLLILTDTYAPGWHATVDGKDATVYRTNFTFRGIPVPAGDHTVYMYYWPDSLTWGIRIMVGGIALLLASLFFIRGHK